MQKILENLIMLVHHHIKYKEIHGVDEVVMMEKGEHNKLHRRLRREGKCNVPQIILHKISSSANSRRDNSRVLDWYKRHREKSIIRMRIYNNRKRLLSLRPDLISSII